MDKNLPQEYTYKNMVLKMPSVQPPMLWLAAAQKT